MLRIVATALGIAGGAAPAVAENFELSVYTGAQTAGSSTVTGNGSGGAGAFMFSTDWRGKFEMPPYYGVRLAYWLSTEDAVSLDYSHSKASADKATATANGFDRLDFGGGINVLTANYTRAFPYDGRKWTPYVGGGAGVAIPSIRVVTASGATETSRSMGPAVTGFAGVSWRMSRKASLFAEYKATWSHHEAELTGGGSLDTDITTHALNVGLSYRF